MALLRPRQECSLTAEASGGLGTPLRTHSPSPPPPHSHLLQKRSEFICSSRAVSKAAMSMQPGQH